MAKRNAKAKTLYVPADYGPAEPLERGERIIELPSERGGARRAVNVSRLELTSEQEAAAETIRRVYLARTAGLFAKVQNFERVDRSAPRDCSANMIRDQRRYRAWVDDMGPLMANLVLSYAVDQRTCAEIDREWAWREGTAADAVRSGLDLFCGVRA